MKVYFLIFLLAFISIYSCNSNGKSIGSNDFNTEVKDEQQILIESEISSKTLINHNLVDLTKINSAIKIDLKYASEDNFMKMKLYSKIKKAYLQKDVAIRLSKCQTFLTSINPNLYLLVYDAVRPLSVQKKMWDALDSIPFYERTKFVSNPENGSVHNYGAAVDLTICDEKSQPLDMGAGYDDIRKVAYPSLEMEFLASGEITQTQINNRVLLRKVMSSQGFKNIPSEWWHFNACPRSEAKEKYVQLLEE